MMLIRDRGMFICCLAWLMAVTSGQSYCHSSCMCKNTSVSCNGLYAFPTGSFPETTEVIYLSRANMSRIPSGAFSRLPHLRRLYLYQVSVDTVEGCALNGLHNVEEISLEQVTIEELQSYAISDLVKLDRLRLKECTVTSVQSRAIHNVSSLAALQMRAVSLQSVEPQAFSSIASLQDFSAVNVEWGNLSSNAFYNLSIGRLSLENMTINWLDCGVLESLRQHSDRVSMSDILLSECPCDNQPLLKDAIAHEDVYSGVLCFLSATFSIQPLSSACGVDYDDPGVCQSDSVVLTPHCVPTSTATLTLSAPALHLFLLLLLVVLAC